MTTAPGLALTSGSTMGRPARPPGGVFCGDCENYYSFDIGPVHFVGIDDNQRQVDYPAGAVDWIIADLDSTTAQWKVVFMKHNPAITWTESASMNAQFLMPIFDTGGVDLVVTGGNSLGFTQSGQRRVVSACRHGSRRRQRVFWH